jgi:uncharacterized damage-inducible protein DinB
MTIERQMPKTTIGEREMLREWLDFHRATLLWKCEGLTDDQLRERSAAPSSMSLLGLVRHMAEVERFWFRRTFIQEDAGSIYCSKDNQDGDFDDVDKADVVADFETYRAECEAALAIEAKAASLDVKGKWKSSGDPRGGDPTLRWIMTHMIEEYARHNGHADILRERIDGATGD